MSYFGHVNLELKSDCDNPSAHYAYHHCRMETVFYVLLLLKLNNNKYMFYWSYE